MLAFFHNRRCYIAAPNTASIPVHRWGQLPTGSKRRPRKLHSTKDALQLKTHRTSQHCVAARKVQTSKNTWERSDTSELLSSSWSLPFCCWCRSPPPREARPVRERLHVRRPHIAHRGPRISPDECSRLSVFPVLSWLLGILTTAHHMQSLIIHLCTSVKNKTLHSPTWNNITTEKTQNWTSAFISVRSPNVGLPKFWKLYIFF